MNWKLDLLMQIPYLLYTILEEALLDVEARM
jgi:hypothetical protein